MSLGWIDVNEFSINCLLLFERFQLSVMGNHSDNDAWRDSMGIVLKYHPHILWYCSAKCPEHADLWSELAAKAPPGLDEEQVRRAELLVMDRAEDFVIYTRPELMDSHCDFIYAWDKERLFEMAEFAGKTVLDIGAGSGRLAFAAAERAAWVYASEPVDSLREYLLREIARRGIGNMRVVNGMMDRLPYPDSTFDIVLSGHVMGDDYPAEMAEITRVVKSGGWLIDCPGEDPCKREPDTAVLAQGWEELYYQSKLGGDVYRYRKQVFK